MKNGANRVNSAKLRPVLIGLLKVRVFLSLEKKNLQVKVYEPEDQDENNVHATKILADFELTKNNKDDRAYLKIRFNGIWQMGSFISGDEDSPGKFSLGSLSYGKRTDKDRAMAEILYENGFPLDRFCFDMILSQEASKQITWRNGQQATYLKKILEQKPGISEVSVMANYMEMMKWLHGFNEWYSKAYLIVSLLAKREPVTLNGTSSIVPRSKFEEANEEIAEANNLIDTAKKIISFSGHGGGAETFYSPVGGQQIASEKGRNIRFIIKNNSETIEEETALESKSKSFGCGYYGQAIELRVDEKDN